MKKIGNHTLINVDDNFTAIINYTLDEGNCSQFGIIGNVSSQNHVSFTSQQYPSELAVPLYGYAMPILLVVTTFANTIIVAILQQRHMRSPTNVMLIAISLSDLFTLVFPAPLFFYMYTLGYYIYPLYPVQICYAWFFMSDVMPNLFHTASIWLTLGLAVQRYIYVCHAPVARIWCNIPRVIKSIFWVFFAAFLHQLTRFFEYYFIPTCVYLNDQYYPACRIYLADWVNQNQDIYYGIYFWFRVIFVHLGPCTALVVLNMFLFRALRKAQKKREQLLKEKKKNESKRLRDSNCTTMMLIVIVTVFLVTEIPLAVITLLHLLTGLGIVNVFTEDDYDFVRTFFIVSNFFIILSYPINFAIYCGMSRQFRETFRELIMHGKVKPRREDSSRSSCAPTVQIPSPTAPGTPSSQQSINVIQNDEQNKTISILKVPEAPVLRPSNEVYISPATVESSRRESNVCQRGEEKRHLSVHFESLC
ncbi:Sex peptide receptor [Armadillidium vulgare]|nr:Sex peptide receptor [Armadillidium vulgare]